MMRFLSTLIVLLLITFGLTLPLDWWYRRTYQLAYPRVAPLFGNPPRADKYQIVKVGNSHAEDGITFEGYRLRGLDLAGVAQRFRFDRALLEQYRREIDDDAIILITVSPISFAHRKADRNDGLQGNYYGQLSPLQIPDLVWSNYLQSQVVPSLRIGYELRSRYGEMVRERVAAAEKWEEPAASVSAAPVVVAAPVEVEDPRQFTFLDVARIRSELAAPTPVSEGPYMDTVAYLFHKWYSSDEFGEQYFVQNRRDLEELITYAQSQGWRPVLVTIPLSAPLTEGLLDDFLQKYLYDNVAATNTHGAPFFDFNDRQDLSENLFLYSNSDHLSKDGGRVYSYLLLQRLIEEDLLSREADGYFYAQK